MVANDVAERCLDIKGVECVINFDFPNNVKDYVHHIGRAGHIGANGTAIKFFSHNNNKSSLGLCDLISEAGQDVPEELNEISRNKRVRGERNSRYRSGGLRCGGGGGAGGRRS